MEIDPTTTAAAASKDAKTKGNVKQQRQPSAAIDSTNKKKPLSTQPTEIISDQLSLSEPIEERQRPTLQLQQLNTVIFGLPNLTFTP